jgi:carboxyl-terminal processing protease
MVDETAEGNVFAALRTREADLQKHLVNGTEAKPAPMTDAQRAAEQQRDQDREAARKRLEEEAKKNPSQRLVPEFGSDKDFQLQQALNQLKGKPVLVSKTLQVRSTDDRKTN